METLCREVVLGFGQSNLLRSSPAQRWNRRQHSSQRARALEASSDFAAPDLQALILGASVVAATGASLYWGFKGDPVSCKKCGGNGGTRCVFCSDGKMRSDGRNSECRVCKGSGLVLCKDCKGSGYSRWL